MVNRSKSLLDTSSRSKEQSDRDLLRLRRKLNRLPGTEDAIIVPPDDDAEWTRKLQLPSEEEPE